MSVLVACRPLWPLLDTFMTQLRASVSAIQTLAMSTVVLQPSSWNTAFSLSSGYEDFNEDFNDFENSFDDSEDMSFTTRRSLRNQSRLSSLSSSSRLSEDGDSVTTSFRYSGGSVTVAETCENSNDFTANNQDVIDDPPSPKVCLPNSKSNQLEFHLKSINHLTQ